MNHEFGQLQVVFDAHKGHNLLIIRYYTVD